ncbi:MAG: hypothetical protein KDD69_04375 [Bdellovibrionales bacterium]|nr:hypothetical protein [Bdellovibrionales bacterium]
MEVSISQNGDLYWASSDTVNTQWERFIFRGITVVGRTISWTERTRLATTRRHRYHLEIHGKNHSPAVRFVWNRRPKRRRAQAVYAALLQQIPPEVRTVIEAHRKEMALKLKSRVEARPSAYAERLAAEAREKKAAEALALQREREAAVARELEERERWQRDRSRERRVFYGEWSW